MPALVGEDGVIRGPAGDGRVAVVAQDDIADAAAAVLLEPAAHVGATYTLTGPEALSLDEVAAILTAGLGRPVTYVRETVDEAYASRASYGAPRWQLDAWVSTYTAIADGEVAPVSDDIPRLTGHPATSLAELIGRGGAASDRAGAHALHMQRAQLPAGAIASASSSTDRSRAAAVGDWWATMSSSASACFTNRSTASRTSLGVPIAA